jgi:hypothetical protein
VTVVIEPTVELEDEIAARIGELLQRRGLGELAVHPQREAVDAMLFQGSGENKSAQVSADTDVSRAEEERAPISSLRVAYGPESVEEQLTAEGSHVRFAIVTPEKLLDINISAQRSTR